MRIFRHALAAATTFALLGMSSLANAQIAAAPEHPVSADSWEEGDPIPTGYHTAREMRTGLVAGGTALFVGTYALSLLQFALSESANGGCPGGNTNLNVNGCSPVMKDLPIPFVGPFVQVGTAGISPAGNLVLVLDGIAQIGGLAMVTLGLTVRKTVLVENDVAQGQTKGLELSFAPIVSPGNAGMGVIGRF